MMLIVELSALLEERKVNKIEYIKQRLVKAREVGYSIRVKKCVKFLCLNVLLAEKNPTSAPLGQILCEPRRRWRHDSRSAGSSASGE